MVLISEWLPNPTGADASGEWVELFNDGGAAASLRGWTIKTSGGKSFTIKNASIQANSYLVLRRQETKLVLKNSDEKIFLYDAQGRLADSSGFMGAAPEGKSFSRTAPTGNGFGNNFAFADPTPGAPNALSGRLALISNSYPSGKPLASGFAAPQFLELMIGAALLLSVFSLILLKRNEKLSDLFFGGDQEIR